MFVVPPWALSEPHSAQTCAVRGRAREKRTDGRHTRTRTHEVTHWGRFYNPHLYMCWPFCVAIPTTTCPHFAFSRGQHCRAGSTMIQSRINRCPDYVPLFLLPAPMARRDQLATISGTVFLGIAQEEHLATSPSW